MRKLIVSAVLASGLVAGVAMAGQATYQINVSDASFYPDVVIPGASCAHQPVNGSGSYTTTCTVNGTIGGLVDVTITKESRSFDCALDSALIPYVGSNAYLLQTQDGQKNPGVEYGIGTSDIEFNLQTAGGLIDPGSCKEIKNS